MDEVLDELLEDGGDIVERVAPLEEPAAKGALDARESIAPIDEVTFADVGIEGFVSGMDGKRIDGVPPANLHE